MKYHYFLEATLRIGSVAMATFEFKKICLKQGRFHLGDVEPGAVCPCPLHEFSKSCGVSSSVEHCAREAAAKEADSFCPLESLQSLGECGVGGCGGRKTQRINKSLQHCV